MYQFKLSVDNKVYCIEQNIIEGEVHIFQVVLKQ